MLHLKDNFTQQWKIIIIISTPLESRLKFPSPQKHSWSFTKNALQHSRQQLKKMCAGFKKLEKFKQPHEK